MARIRSIKPEFFTSETIAALPLSARLTFIGLWTYVDDNGVGPDNSRLVMAAIFPLDDDPRETLVRVSGDLQSLAAAGLIQRYEVDGRRLLYVRSWDDHQKVQHPGRQRYARPLTCENSNPHETFPPSSRDSHESLTPEQGAGSREQGAGKVRTAAPSEPPRIDVEQVCTAMADAVESNGSRRPSVTESWRREARLMLDRDARPLSDVLSLIAWTAQDEFWRANVMSIPKLREKYDRLRLQRDSRGRRSVSEAHVSLPPEEYEKPGVFGTPTVYRHGDGAA